MRLDIQYTYEHDLCSQLLLKYSHSLNYKFVSENRDNVFVHRLAKHDNDISLSKQYVRLNNLYYVKYSYFLTWRKDNKCIETKVAAINCGGLTFN